MELGGLSLQLYNTRTRRVDAFQPLRDNEVRIYVCGMTPSAQAHLGHARSFLFFDVLRRFLAYRGYRVTYVQNVTDVDDRSIDQAKATGEDYHVIIDRYYDEFKASMRKLGVLKYDREPYATHYIAPIRETIRKLLDGGHAYVNRDGIYYRVSTFANYGKLANRNIEELESGARIEVDEHKEDPLDFALWKFAKPGEPKWPFEPYGDGRPGWHIECSAMARALLDPGGTGFDIHGGGADLIFPHHENEIAQSEPLMGRPPMANVWMHGGLLLFDNRKMSKSLGNFEPLSSVLDRHDPQAIRLLFLRTGYRKVMNFTEGSMASARADLQSLKTIYRALHAAGPSAAEPGLLAQVGAALDDDMNTAVALAIVLKAGGTLAEFATALTILGIEPNPSWLQEAKGDLEPDFVERLHVAAGIDLDGVTAEGAIERVVELRNAAREARDWENSDRLRDALLQCGIEVKDSKEGTTWSVAAQT